MCRGCKGGTTVSCLGNAHTKPMEEPWVWFRLVSIALVEVEVEVDAQDVSKSQPAMTPIESRHMVKEDSHHTPQAHQSIGKSSMYNIPVNFVNK